MTSPKRITKREAMAPLFVFWRLSPKGISYYNSIFHYNDCNYFKEYYYICNVRMSYLHPHKIK